MKEIIGHRIRKLRESKDYSQQNMADDLSISLSAYSKIERGVTDTSVNRLEAIAKILEVEAIYFYKEQQEQPVLTKAEDERPGHGYASKSEVEELSSVIRKIQREIASLKASLQAPPPVKTAKKKA